MPSVDARATENLKIDFVSSRHAEARFSDFQTQAIIGATMGNFLNGRYMVVRSYARKENRRQGIIKHIGELKFSIGVLLLGKLILVTYWRAARRRRWISSRLFLYGGREQNK